MRGSRFSPVTPFFHDYVQPAWHYNAVVPLSPMYPPRSGSDGRQQRVSDASSCAVLGLLWLVLGVFRYLSSNNLVDLLVNIAVAVAFWTQAILAKAGVPKRTRILLAVGMCMLIILAWWVWRR